MASKYPVQISGGRTGKYITQFANCVSHDQRENKSLNRVKKTEIVGSAKKLASFFQPQEKKTDRLTFGRRVSPHEGRSGSKLRIHWFFKRPIFRSALSRGFSFVARKDLGFPSPTAQIWYGTVR